MIRRFVCPISRILLFFLLTLLCTEGHAHRPFPTYLVHYFEFQSPQKPPDQVDTLDFKFSLTFFEEAAQIERKKLDANGDGVFSVNEIKSRLQTFEPKITEQITIQYKDNTLTPTTLYSPDVNLDVETHHEIIPLSYTFYLFIRLPKVISSIEELQFVNKLYKNTPAILIWQNEQTEPITRANRRLRSSQMPIPIMSKSFDSVPRQFSLNPGEWFHNTTNLSGNTKESEKFDYTKWIAMILISAGLAFGVWMNHKKRERDLQ